MLDPGVELSNPRAVRRAIAALVTRRWRRIVGRGAALVVVIGCGGPAAAPASPGDPAVPSTAALSQRYEALADKLCACKDAACTARETATFANAADRAVLDAGQIARWASEPAVAAVTQRMTACIAVQARDAARARRRAAASTSARHLMDSYAQFVDDVCACKDQACIATATEGFGRANAEAARDLNPEDANAMAEDPRFMELTKRMTDCATRIATSAAQPP